MSLHHELGLEIERREKVMKFDEWIRQECFKAPPEHSVELAKSVWDYKQQAIDALSLEWAKQQARIEAAIEVYAGMEGFIPETAAEGYCLRIIEQMNRALLGESHETE